MATIVFELVALAWIRWRFFAPAFLRSSISVAIGGAISANVSAAARRSQWPARSRKGEMSSRRHAVESGLPDS